MRILKIYLLKVKDILKLYRTKIRLFNVNYNNLYPWTFIGKYCVFFTDFSSSIFFNNYLTINNFVSFYLDSNTKLFFGVNVYIGDYSTIRGSNSILKIGDNTMIAQGVKLIGANHNYMEKERLIIHQGMNFKKNYIYIGNDCWIGSGVTILPGVKIGNGVVVGANSVVTKDIPDYAISVGVPAKVINFRK